MKNFLIGFCLISFLLPITAQSKKSKKENTYATKERLFYIERVKNKNIISYDVNLNKENKPDPEQPLNVYWINREKNPGEKEELSHTEERMAYGYKVLKSDSDTIKITLTAFDSRILSLVSHDNNYICLVDIDKQPARLDKIYVKTTKPNSLSVEYVELYGINISSGKSCSERIKP